MSWASFFIALQLLAYYGFVEINWLRIQEGVDPFLRPESLQAWWEELVRVLTLNLPFAAAFIPGLLVGFAAETGDVTENARAKLAAKGADWIVANDVSGDVLGGADNSVHLVTADGVEDWPRMSKAEVATRLADRIAEALADA